MVVSWGYAVVAARNDSDVSRGPRRIFGVMKMLTRAVVPLAATLVLSACAGSSRHIVLDGPSFRVHLHPPSPAALRFPTASNRRFAYADVQRLIRILVLPLRSRLVAKVPRSAPLRFRHVIGMRFVPGFAVTHRIWIVHQPLERVVRFVRAHAHPRPRPEAHFRGKNNGVRLRPVGSYAFPPVPGRSWQRWLNVDMVALSGGGTVVIAQAGDAWIHTSPRSALLPTAVKRIDVLSRNGSSRPNVLVHVREPYDVGSIVSLVNGLGLANAEHIMCADDFFGGPTVTLRFRAANGKVLARATVADILGGGYSGPCNPLQLTLRGRTAPPLIGADLLLQIQRLLTIVLAPPTPHEVSACLLRRHGWKVRSVAHNQMVDRVQHFPPELTASKSGTRWTIIFHYSGKVTFDKKGPRALERCVRTGPRYVIYG
jgi:hypothetical protein